MKTVTLHDFLTEDEIQAAIQLCDRKKVRDEIIVPNMARINEALGQENDADYLALMVEYVFVRAEVWIPA